MDPARRKKSHFIRVMRREIKIMQDGEYGMTRTRVGRVRRRRLVY